MKWAWIGLTGLFLIVFYWIFIHPRFDLYHPIRNNWIPQRSQAESAGSDYEDKVNELYRKGSLELARKLSNGQITNSQAREETERLVRERQEGLEIANRLRGNAPSQPQPFTQVQIPASSVPDDPSQYEKFIFPATFTSAVPELKMLPYEDLVGSDGTHTLTFSAVVPNPELKGHSISISEVGGKLHMIREDAFYVGPQGWILPSEIPALENPQEFLSEYLIGQLLYHDGSEYKPLTAGDVLEPQSGVVPLRMNLRVTPGKKHKRPTGGYIVKYKVLR